MNDKIPSTLRACLAGQGNLLGDRGNPLFESSAVVETDCFSPQKNGLRKDEIRQRLCEGTFSVTAAIRYLKVPLLLKQIACPSGQAGFSPAKKQGFARTKYDSVFASLPAGKGRGTFFGDRGNPLFRIPLLLLKQIASAL